MNIVNSAKESGAFAGVVLAAVGCFYVALLWDFFYGHYWFLAGLGVFLKLSCGVTRRLHDSACNSVATTSSGHCASLSLALAHITLCYLYFIDLALLLYQHWSLTFGAAVNPRAGHEEEGEEEARLDYYQIYLYHHYYHKCGVVPMPLPLAVATVIFVVCNAVLLLCYLHGPISRCCLALYSSSPSSCSASDLPLRCPQCQNDSMLPTAYKDTRRENADQCDVRYGITQDTHLYNKEWN